LSNPWCLVGILLRLSILRESPLPFRCTRTKLNDRSTEWQRDIYLLGVKRILKVDAHRFGCKTGSYQDTSFKSAEALYSVFISRRDHSLQRGDSLHLLGAICDENEC
jgi:hypothetical protein